MFLNRSGWIHRCILSSFGSFGWAFSEEKIKVWKVNGRRTPSDWKKLTLSLVEQKLLSLPEFTTSEVRVDQSLVSIYHCLLSVGRCIACPLIYGFWLTLWNLSLFCLPGLRFVHSSIYKIFHVSSICLVYTDYCFCTVSCNDILHLSCWLHLC